MTTRLEKNWLEWLVFGCGLLLVVATIGYLVYEQVAGESTPPDIVVSLGQPRSVSAGYAVPVRATNRGTETAEEVVIEVTLEVSGEAPERAEFTIAFLPRNSTREGAVTFERDPRSGRLTARPLGYGRP